MKSGLPSRLKSNANAEIVADNVQAYAFRRGCGNVRALAGAVKSVLHIQVSCRAKPVASQVAKIAPRILVKGNEIVESAIDREETLAIRAGVARVEARPGE